MAEVDHRERRGASVGIAATRKTVGQVKAAGADTEALDFYRLVLPQHGRFALWFKGTTQHHWASSLEELAAITKRHANTPGWYFATAAFDGERRRKQDNVIAKRCLYLDLDAGPEKLAKHGPDEVYATNGDAQRDLVCFARETKLLPSIIVHSGAGLHVYWVFDRDLTDAEWLPLAEGLGRLAKARGLKVDASCTTDSARVLRPVGAVHDNGEHARVLKHTRKVYGVEELRRLLSVDAPAKTATRARKLDVNALLPADEFAPVSALKVAERCAAFREIAAARGDVPEPQWRAMLGLVKFTTEGEDQAHEWSRGHPDYDPADTRAKLDRWAGTGPTTCAEFSKHTKACNACEHKGKLTTPAILGRAPVTLPALVDIPLLSPSADVHADAEEPSAETHATDLGLSRLFVRQYSPSFRYDHSSRGWRRYTGGAWVPCRKGEQQEAFKTLSAHIMKKAGEAQELRATDKAKTLLACAMRAQSAHGIESALKLAASAKPIATSTDEFDRAPDLLNVTNGVVHLPTGELRSHAPDLMLSRQCTCDYVPGATAPTWLRFLADVTSEDADLTDYLQRACGYTLSGYVTAEKLFFMLGTGANGKSVFANLLRRILGTYSVVVPSAFLMLSQRDGGSATPELAMVAGARLVLANEVEAGASLSGQMVKVAVSTEAITARALYAAPVTFLPTHKLWVRGNHKPIIRDNDEGIWRRLDLIPFERNFAPHERDAGLEASLIAEAPGILAWMVEGFKKWRRDCLRPARRVDAASRAYRTESDLLQQWVAECCEVSPGFTAPQGAAFGSYGRWCDEQRLRTLSKRSFTRGLVERGYGEGREGGGARQHVYTGFRLTA